MRRKEMDPMTPSFSKAHYGKVVVFGRNISTAVSFTFETGLRKQYDLFLKLTIPLDAKSRFGGEKGGQQTLPISFER